MFLSYDLCLGDFYEHNVFWWTSSMCTSEFADISIPVAFVWVCLLRRNFSIQNVPSHLGEFFPNGKFLFTQLLIHCIGWIWSVFSQITDYGFDFVLVPLTPRFVVFFCNSMLSLPYNTNFRKVTNVAAYKGIIRKTSLCLCNSYSWYRFTAVCNTKHRFGYTLSFSFYITTFFFLPELICCICFYIQHFHNTIWNLGERQFD